MDIEGVKACGHFVWTDENGWRLTRFWECGDGKTYSTEGGSLYDPPSVDMDFQGTKDGDMPPVKFQVASEIAYLNWCSSNGRDPLGVLRIRDVYCRVETWEAKYLFLDDGALDLFGARMTNTTTYLNDDEISSEDFDSDFVGAADMSDECLFYFDGSAGNRETLEALGVSDYVKSVAHDHAIVSSAKDAGIEGYPMMMHYQTDLQVQVAAEARREVIVGTQPVGDVYER